MPIYLSLRWLSKPIEYNHIYNSKRIAFDKPETLKNKQTAIRQYIIFENSSENYIYWYKVCWFYSIALKMKMHSEFQIRSKQTNIRRRAWVVVVWLFKRLCIFGSRVHGHKGGSPRWRGNRDSSSLGVMIVHARRTGDEWRHFSILHQYITWVLV